MLAVLRLTLEGIQMRISDFMGELVEINPRMRGTIDGPGTFRHKGTGYRGERRMKAKLAYRAAKKRA